MIGLGLGVSGDNFDPIIPRDRRLQVFERTLADGRVHVAVDIDEVKRQAQNLLVMGCQSIAIAFINAYANPANEIMALKVCAMYGLIIML